MSRLARTMVVALAAAAAAVTALAVLGGADDTYRVDLELESANGLRKGTPVRVAGAEVGTIRDLRVRDDSSVQAELELEGDKAGRIGANASARVLASNLLGSKYVELEPGDGRGPRPAVIPARRVAYPVDLDQVLNILDADTRTRLQILINEAGIAMTGRHADFNVVLRQLPRDFAAAQRLLDRVAADNRALGEAVERSSEFVTRLAAERSQLGRVVDVTQATMSTVARRRAALQAALRRAPRTLDTARAFLTDLRSAAVPLRPAARAIADTAPPLTAALSELPAFRQAAAPTLREARHVAPALERLGLRAAPIVRRARPTLSALSALAEDSGPLARTLDVSIDDINGLIEGWARSIQDGDALGHIFRGKAIASAEAIRTILDNDLMARTRRERATTRRSRRAPRPSTSAPQPDRESARPAAPRPGSIDLKLPGLPEVRVPLPAIPRPPGHAKNVDDLLDFLLAP